MYSSCACVVTVDSGYSVVTVVTVDSGYSVVTVVWCCLKHDRKSLNDSSSTVSVRASYLLRITVQWEGRDKMVKML